MFDATSDALGGGGGGPCVCIPTMADIVPSPIIGMLMPVALAFVFPLGRVCPAADVSCDESALADPLLKRRCSSKAAETPVLPATCMHDTPEQAQPYGCRVSLRRGV